jgi:hypothetical protein
MHPFAYFAATRTGSLKARPARRDGLIRRVLARRAR